MKDRSPFLIRHCIQDQANDDDVQEDPLTETSDANHHGQSGSTAQVGNGTDGWGAITTMSSGGWGTPATTSTDGWGGTTTVSTLSDASLANSTSDDPNRDKISVSQTNSRSGEPSSASNFVGSESGGAASNNPAVLNDNTTGEKLSSKPSSTELEQGSVLGATPATSLDVGASWGATNTNSDQSSVWGAVSSPATPSTAQSGWGSSTTNPDQGSGWGAPQVPKSSSSSSVGSTSRPDDSEQKGSGWTTPNIAVSLDSSETSLATSTASAINDNSGWNASGNGGAVGGDGSGWSQGGGEWRGARDGTGNGTASWSDGNAAWGDVQDHQKDWDR